MKKILIIHSSVDGQTEKICSYIKRIFDVSSKVEMASFDDEKENILTDFDLIIVGASIRYGKYRPNVIKFVNKNYKILNKIPNAFFSVNVVARKENKSSPETNPYVQKFLLLSKWKPLNLAVFAGKVDYPNYSLLNKYIILFIMFLTDGPKDTSQSFEFTNWGKVDLFAKNVLRSLEA